MAKIRWTNLALDDLYSIHEFVGMDSPRYAEVLVDRIIQRINDLEQYPRIGRKVPELDSDLIRELIEGSYRIIYKIESEDKIGILRVHHSARPLKDL